MSSLPPGVTDSMLEPIDSRCARCGHVESEHGYVDDSSCGVLIYKDNVCDCDAFVEGEYEDDYEEDD